MLTLSSPIKNGRINLHWIVPELYPYATPEFFKVPGSQIYCGAHLGEGYPGGMAGLISSGPIDHLTEIIVDGQKVWLDNGPGLYRSGQANPVRLTIKHDYTAWRYWGNAPQTTDDPINALLAAGGLLPCGNQAVLCFPPYFFGRGTGLVTLIECKVASTLGLETATGSADDLWVDAEERGQSLAVLA